MAKPDQFDAKFRAFFDAWASFRGPDEVLPKWDNFRPSVFVDMLPDVSLVQRQERGKYYYCLLGSEMDNRLGYDPTGFNQLDILHPRLRDFVTDWFEAIIDVPCGAYSEFSIELRYDRSMSLKSLSLPLLDQEGEPNWFLYFHDAGEARTGIEFGDLLSFGEQFAKMTAIDLGAGLATGLPNSI